MRCPACNHPVHPLFCNARVAQSSGYVTTELMCGCDLMADPYADPYEEIGEALERQRQPENQTQDDA